MSQRCFSPAEVVEISRVLASVSQDQLRERGHDEALRRFVAETAEAGAGLLLIFE